MKLNALYLLLVLLFCGELFFVSTKTAVAEKAMNTVMDDSMRYNAYHDKYIEHDGSTVEVIRSSDFFEESETNFIVRSRYSLGGKTFKVGKNSRITLETGGELLDGSLIGEDTFIQVHSKQPVFDDVSFLGSFIMPDIRTDYFVCDRNTLKAIVDLSSPQVQNEIQINHDLSVEIPSEWKGVVQSKSNTSFVLNADIKLEPSSYMGGCIFYVRDCDNVSFSGNGHIIGDVKTHIGTTGESIYGIFISNSKNISIKEITCEYFWGDGIYIYPGGITHERNGICDNILIDNVKLDYNRRQGISILGGSNIIIRNCHLLNTGAYLFTPPSAGIDIEPVSTLGYSVENVFIDSCLFINNGSRSRFPYTPNNDIQIVGNNKEVIVSNSTFHSILLMNADNIRLLNCKVEGIIYGLGEKNGRNITIRDSRVNKISRNLMMKRRIKFVHSTVTEIID